MKSHQAEGIPLPPRTVRRRSRSIALDQSKRWNRSRSLAIIATLVGSAISCALLAAVIFWP
jgi:hypothetical protein